MTNISPINTGTIGGPGRIEPTPNASERATLAEPKARRGDDRVEVSDHARYLSKVKELPSVRTELVNRVRGEIAEGKYDTPEKLDLAIDALIEDITGGF